MIKKRFISMLVLLAAVVTGAWATPNSIVINGTPQAGDKSISLTYYFDPANVPGITGYAPTLKVKCAADNKYDEIPLSLIEVLSGTTSITLNTLGEFEAGKTYEVCFAYYNGNWVDEVFQSFVPAVPTYAITVKGGTEDATSWQGKAGEGEYQSLPLTGLEAGTAVSVKYSGWKLVKSVKATKKPTLSLTNPAKGQVIGSDGKNYDYASLPGGVTAVAKICYVSGSNGLALALADEGKMNWSTAISTCAAHTPEFTGGTWKLATKDEWTNMITAAGSYTALRDGFISVGGTNMQSDFYWSSTEGGSSSAWGYAFDDGYWGRDSKDNDGLVRACLAFLAQETVTLNHSANNTWAIAEMPGNDVELEVEYFNITVPTANTADIYAGTTTPLINAGSTTEDGATMKYLVTATNEQPTSTDGFSADVPTAQAITGPGTYYVWYYLDLASGDDSDISALAVEVTVKAYAITMKEGTEDADNWQGKAGEGEYQALPLEGVAAGTAVTVKYNGTKKVKSVKATKTAATVTTAPTAKTGVKVGQNEAIVNAGTAEGGTMMYMLNATQPTSTDGFSATVPTAEGLTAGTYYVWYYVKADDSHTDSEISATGIEVTIAAKAAAEATAEDKGKVIGTDGKIYADVAAATAAATTAVAKIIYIGTTGHATYSHGLALALTDEEKKAWESAIDACSAKNSSTPVTGATWLLASKDQWNYMVGTDGAGSHTALRDGFSGITGASNMQSDYYWSSTPYSTEYYSEKAWYYGFNHGDWWAVKKDNAHCVRACLVF